MIGIAEPFYSIGSFTEPLTSGATAMADIVLFHHIQGCTPGVVAIAEELTRAGHTVHLPDLFDGKVFTQLEDGFAHLQSLDAEGLRVRVDSTVEALPAELVYAGISWGVSHAQRLAQTRPGARGALFFEACFPVTGEWSFGPWPTGLPVQIHGMDQDEFFALEGDLDAARELVSAAGAPQAEVFTYNGNRHLFMDASLPSHDPAAARLALDRTRDFLTKI
ncbi:dienelactone hydrolase family protein [Cryobacterium cheniae]